MEYEKLIKALRYCIDGTCGNCPYVEKCKKNGRAVDQLHKDADAAIEELMAQVKDKDYLIQQQAEEIQRLRADVKKQQEKMIELAKGLPKRGEWHEWDDGDNTWSCSVCGEPFVLIDGTPKENGMKFCPNCGAKMEVQDADK